MRAYIVESVAIAQDHHQPRSLKPAGADKLWVGAKRAYEDGLPYNIGEGSEVARLPFPSSSEPFA
jgi:hypothetical protein